MRAVAEPGQSTRSVPIGTRVLIVSNYFPPEVLGGAEIVAHRQALGLTRDGFDVSVIAGSAGQSGLSVELADGIRIFRLVAPPAGFDHIHRRPELEEHFRSLLRVIRPTIVHLHNLPGLGAGLIVLAKAAGAKVFVTLHDTWGFCLHQTLLREGAQLCGNFTECDLCVPSITSDFSEQLPIRMRRDYIRWCLGHADTLLFPSQSLRDSYERAGLATTRFVSLSNGIDLSSFPARQRDPRDKVTLMCASTLAVHKGVRVLWDALEILLRDNTLTGRWSMVLAGDGPLAPELRARFESGALRSPVSWTGYIPHDAMPAAYDRADVAVLASTCPENQPVTLLEAIASGAALLGTSIGGIPELIDHEQNGFLVPPGDVTALAARMRQLILCPSRVHAFSARNLARRGLFDETATIKRLVELFLRPASALPVPDDFVALCWGEMGGITADSPMSRRLRSLNNRIRLLWHEWVPRDVQIQPSVLVTFGDHFSSGAVGRAIAGRIPIIAPRSISLDTIPGCQGLVHAYDTEAEALDLLETLVASPLPGTR